VLGATCGGCKHAPPKCCCEPHTAGGLELQQPISAFYCHNSISTSRRTGCSSSYLASLCARSSVACRQRRQQQGGGRNEAAGWLGIAAVAGGGEGQAGDSEGHWAATALLAPATPGTAALQHISQHSRGASPKALCPRNRTCPAFCMSAVMGCLRTVLVRLNRLRPMASLMSRVANSQDSCTRWIKAAQGRQPGEERAAELQQNSQARSQLDHTMHRVSGSLGSGDELVFGNCKRQGSACSCAAWFPTPRRLHCSKTKHHK